MALESLERTIHEIQALSVIYNEDCDNDGGNPSTCIFKILSIDEYQLAQHLCETGEEHTNDAISIPTLRVEIILNLSLHVIKNNSTIMKLQITLPKGYPSGVSAIVSIVSITHMNSSRSQRDEFASRLNEKCNELAGYDSEALMELIQYVQENATQFLCSSEKDATYERKGNTIGHNEYSKTNKMNNISPFSRRWIWVHHISNNNRCKDIVQEARDMNLSGYLKKGYPGVIVIEGESESCDAYVQWVKGNKSRPGGFGRNWGHHVRGEVLLQQPKESNSEGGDAGNKNDQIKCCSRAFTGTFEDIGEDLAEFAKLCRDAGTEDEFKKYVMQH